MQWDPPSATEPVGGGASSGLRITVRTRVAARLRAFLAACLVLACAGALIAVEAALLARGHTLAADIVSAVLVFVFLNSAVVALKSDWPERWVTSRALQALALVSLARVVAFGLPLGDGSAAAATLVVAALIGLAAAWAAPRLGAPLRPLLAFRASADQACAADAGLVLGLGAYLVGAPTLWTRGAAVSAIVLAVIAALAASVTEELLFRGVVQTTLERSAGRAGVLAATALYAVTYLSLGTGALVMMVALAGLVFAIIVARTGNLTGAMTGHALFALGAGGVWPALLGRRHHPWVHGSDVLLVLGAGLAAMTVILLWTAITRNRLAPR